MEFFDNKKCPILSDEDLLARKSGCVLQIHYINWQDLKQRDLPQMVDKLRSARAKQQCIINEERRRAAMTDEERQAEDEAKKRQIERQKEEWRQEGAEDKAFMQRAGMVLSITAATVWLCGKMFS